MRLLSVKSYPEGLPRFPEKSRGSAIYEFLQKIAPYASPLLSPWIRKVILYRMRYMAHKQFLEEYPLYRKFDTGLMPTGGYYDPNYVQIKQIPKPSVNIDCTRCGRQTFNMVNVYGNDEDRAAGTFIEVLYKCASCHISAQRYFVNFFEQKVQVPKKDGSTSTETHLFVQKVGQYPAWAAKLDKGLEDLLGEHAEHYRKGLANEGQSYGIGAYAYYRRVTEDVIDDLLESISDLITDGPEKAAYEEALEQVKKTRVAQDKIDLVKDLLPKSLKPDGYNPLGVLHSALSEGLHTEDDETCLEYANEIKGVLIFLVNKVLREKNEAKEFTESMRKILEKKNPK